MQAGEANVSEWLLATLYGYIEQQAKDVKAEVPPYDASRRELLTAGDPSIFQRHDHQVRSLVFILEGMGTLCCYFFTLCHRSWLTPVAGEDVERVRLFRSRIMKPA